MKLLYGLYDFDGGDIKIKGENMSHITPKIAIEKGIGMVHQEFMLVSELTVLENIILGFEPRKGCTIDFDKAKKYSAALYRPVRHGYTNEQENKSDFRGRSPESGNH